MTVTVRFCGAARTVTGSCYLFQSSNGRLLVDCGLFQGSKTLKALNYGAFPFRPADIDVVLLTHAHIDHSGLLPKLIRDGFRGRIMATRGTLDLCSYLLPDAGSIQELEVATLNRRNTARGRSAVSPIYTKADAIASLDAFRPYRLRGLVAGDARRPCSLLECRSPPWVSVYRTRICRRGCIQTAVAGPRLRRHRSRRQAAPTRPEAPSGFDYVISRVDLRRQRPSTYDLLGATPAACRRGA